MDFAQNLHVLLSPHLPSFPFPTSVKRPPVLDGPRTPDSCNTNIRVYKYAPSQYFGFVFYVADFAGIWSRRILKAPLRWFCSRSSYGGQVRMDPINIFNRCGGWRRGWRGKPKLLSCLLILSDGQVCRLYSIKKRKANLKRLSNLLWSEELLCFIGKKALHCVKFLHISWYLTTDMAENACCMRELQSRRVPNTSYGRIWCSNEWVKPWHCNSKV